MQPSNIYWQPEKWFFRQTTLKPIVNTLGFWVKTPYPEPVSSGHYYGEGRNELYGQHGGLSQETRPEMFAIDGRLPTMSNNVPRYNLKADYMKIKRN